MADAAPKDVLLQDPLSEVTRKERKMLLGASILGVALVKTGLVPTKISALGVEFEKANQQALLGIVALVALYFLAAFVIYAAADFLAWRRAIRSYLVDRVRERMEREKHIPPQLIEEEEAKIAQRVRGAWIVFALSGPVSYVRAFFEFVVPCVVGTYAVLLLFSAVWRV